jgi:hypothetical protein
MVGYFVTEGAKVQNAVSYNNYYIMRVKAAS